MSERIITDPAAMWVAIGRQPAPEPDDVAFNAAIARLRAAGRRRDVDARVVVDGELVEATWDVFDGWRAAFTYCPCGCGQHLAEHHSWPRDEFDPDAVVVEHWPDGTVDPEPVAPVENWWRHVARWHSGDCRATYTLPVGERP